MATRISIVGANCETELLQFPQTSFFILHGGIHYLMFYFLIWNYTWNDFVKSYFVFATFQCGILGQVWYLIV